MNILSVGETEITLHGFNKIKDNIYFVFRKNGLVITNNINDIKSEYIKSIVTNKVITDQKLQKELIAKGYHSDYAFIEHAGHYYYTSS